MVEHVWRDAAAVLLMSSAKRPNLEKELTDDFERIFSRLVGQLDLERSVADEVSFHLKALAEANARMSPFSLVTALTASSCLAISTKARLRYRP